MDIIKNFKRNKTAFLASILRRVSFLFKDDEMYLKLLYLFELHKWPDLKQPRTFNEKIQWLKLHDRKPEYIKMVDKYAVKDYVAGIIGEEHIIPTLGVWDRFDDINFDELPRQFVLKTTHGGGGMAVVICKDKTTFDKAKARRILERSLHGDIYKAFREWPYKDVPKRIIVEKFMATEVGEDGLKDYKFFCFNGSVKFFKIDFGRFTDHHANYYDTDGKLLPFGEAAYSPQLDADIHIPSTLKEMVTVAEKLSKGIPFLRVDLYSIYGRVYFGEITFYPASGLGKIAPNGWDEKIGNRLELPMLKLKK